MPSVASCSPCANLCSSSYDSGACTLLSCGSTVMYMTMLSLYSVIASIPYSFQGLLLSHFAPQYCDRIRCETVCAPVHACVCTMSSFIFTCSVWSVLCRPSRSVTRRPKWRREWTSYVCPPIASLPSHTSRLLSSTLFTRSIRYRLNAFATVTVLAGLLGQLLSSYGHWGYTYHRSQEAWFPIVVVTFVTAFIGAAAVNTIYSALLPALKGVVGQVRAYPT